MGEEAIVKLAILIIVVMGAVYFGLIVLAALSPVFAVAVIADFAVRSGYNKKLAAVRSSGQLVTGPDVYQFDARWIDDVVVLGWHVSLPNGAHMDVFRLTDGGGGSPADIADRGFCVHSTSVELADARETAFFDYDVPDGVHYYVPVLTGLEVRREPQAYGFLDFWRDVRFTERKRTTQLRGNAVRVEVSRVAKELPDLTDPTDKLVDDILGDIRARKKLDADLDVAVERIRQSPDLTDDEKAQAIELLETRAGEF